MNIVLLATTSIDDATKSEVARWVLFLKTDLPYEWEACSAPQTLGMLMANIFTLGMANRFFFPRFAAQGDISVWPFIRKSDYETALRNHPYLRAQVSHDIDEQKTRS